MRCSQDFSARHHAQDPAADQREYRAACYAVVLNTVTDWLILAVREAVPKAQHLATAESATNRLWLLKLGDGIRASVSRAQLAFAAAYSNAEPLRHPVEALGQAPALATGLRHPCEPDPGLSAPSEQFGSKAF